MPDTFSPSCFSVTVTLFAPCGELIVTSQSPVRFVCASAGAASSATTSTASPERVMIRLLSLRIAAHAMRRQRSFADISQPGGAADVFALDRAVHRNGYLFALLGDGPLDGDLIVDDAPAHRKLAIFVDHASGQRGPPLVDRHVQGDFARRHDEFDAPVPGDVRLRDRR